MCACGLAVETLEHRWWACPRWEAQRAKFLIPGDGPNFAKKLAAPMRKLGLPTWLTPLWQRKMHWAGTRKDALAGQATYFTDGSGQHPRDEHLRTVAWAVSWWSEGRWCSVSGAVAGQQTVPRAELTALLVAVHAAQLVIGLFSV